MSIKDFGKPINQQVKDDLKEYFKDRDYMVIAVAEKEPIRVYTLKATNTVQKAQLIHRLSPILATITGRVLCGALLLSSMIKHGTHQKLVLKLETEGPIRSIAAEVDGLGNARCMVNTEPVQEKIKEVDCTFKAEGEDILVVCDDVVEGVLITEDYSRSVFEDTAVKKAMWSSDLKIRDVLTNPEKIEDTLKEAVKDELKEVHYPQVVRPERILIDDEEVDGFVREIEIDGSKYEDIVIVRW